ncbi:thioredoxin-like protein [Coccomyxa subellipsoidea C-169]|uniref:Thioredoxin-like protein n=1 Tax=Coccomyxa subellipsoidea (strain C-169) TaxID=574566 RepID=I0YL37_COCSC|nr:thioredoxin-like protein [Coccomyxa subellipsoidea C-169]EIE19106.1 thioredoxin-like protein [Coccomyxa subellipsoidea C-169]|eukprot:XP_005643650.1 thioredoxin-like protein [Coccomyxa subellipsoidea C-169]
MAFTANCFAQPPQTRIPQTSGSCKVLPQQLKSLSSPLPLTQCRRARIAGAAAAVAGVAIPHPGYSGLSPAQIGRSLLRTTSTSMSESAERLNRTLSGKVLNDTEAVVQVHSALELEDKLQRHDGKLVVLMCKAASCRPCKMFARKYQRMAAEFSTQGAVFLEILGDESADTRKLMISMQIRVTPTFCLFRGTEVVQTVTGVNAENLQNAVREQLAM